MGKGKIVDIGATSKGAKFVKVEYKNGDVIRFLHLSSVKDGLKVGLEVSEGQILGYTGESGAKGRPHLHVDGVDKDGNSINPEAVNYGDYTNQEFFEKYGGDYTKLPENGEASQHSEVSGGLEGYIKNSEEYRATLKELGRLWKREAYLEQLLDEKMKKLQEINKKLDSSNKND